MNQRWIIPNLVLLETAHAFRRYANEVFVLWTAPSSTAAQDLAVSRCIVPEQRAGRTPQGVYVHIDGEELSRIQIENYRRRERSIVQLHTHPGQDVRMSELDREWEVVAHTGALSIIVPFYGRDGLQGFPGVNVYEREDHDWRLWGNYEVRARLLCR